MARAALAILGQHGSRNLTHRAIDKYLAIPEGTTSAYFRRREDLVGAAVRELFRSDFGQFEQGIGGLLASGRPITLEVVVAFYARMISGVRYNTSDAERLARYECFLLARRDHEANRLLEDMFDTRQKLDAQLFEHLGAPDPQTSAIRLGYTLRGVFFSLAFLPEPSARLDVVDDEFVRRAIVSAMTD